MMSHDELLARLEALLADLREPEKTGFGFLGEYDNGKEAGRESAADSLEALLAEARPQPEPEPEKVTRYAIRLAEINHAPVTEGFGYVTPKNRREPRRGYTRIEKKYSETPVTTWANRETAQTWADKMTYDFGSQAETFVVEEVQQ